jgi:hypothetical protein
MKLREIVSQINRPLVKVPALTLNPSPKLGRGTLKSGSPSLQAWEKELGDEGIFRLLQEV